jgi:uncharacterized membrane protein
MSLRVHELHAATFHAPLLLMPAAAAVDLTAALGGVQRRAPRARLGRVLWWLAAAAGLAAAATGMAAIDRRAAREEVSPESGDTGRGTPEMIWLHGAGSSSLLLAGLALVLRRTFRPPHITESVLALIASGVGLAAGCRTAMARRRHCPPAELAVARAHRSPPVLSRAAPRAFVRDAARGLSWFVSQTARVVRGEPLRR